MSTLVGVEIIAGPAATVCAEMWCLVLCSPSIREARGPSRCAKRRGHHVGKSRSPSAPRLARSVHFAGEDAPRDMARAGYCSRHPAPAVTTAKTRRRPMLQMQSADAADSDAAVQNCLDLGEVAIEIGTAQAADDYAFAVTAHSTTDTKWDRRATKRSCSRCMARRGPDWRTRIRIKASARSATRCTSGPRRRRDRLARSVPAVRAARGAPGDACDVMLTPASALGADPRGSWMAAFRWPVRTHRRRAARPGGRRRARVIRPCSRTRMAARSSSAAVVRAASKRT